MTIRPADVVVESGTALQRADVIVEQEAAAEVTVELRIFARSGALVLARTGATVTARST